MAGRVRQGRGSRRAASASERSGGRQRHPAAAPTERGNLNSDGMLRGRSGSCFSVRPAAATSHRPKQSCVTVSPRCCRSSASRRCPLLLELEPEVSEEGTRSLYLKFSADMVQAGMVTEPSASFGTFCGKLRRVLLTMTLLLHLVDLPSGGPSRTSRSCRDAAACTGHHRPVCACAWARLLWAHHAGGEHPRDRLLSGQARRPGHQPARPGARAAVAAQPRS